MTTEPDAATLAARIQGVLADQHVLTLACRDGQGCWASAVFFAAEGLELIFCSPPDSRHVRALAVDARLAGEIHAQAHDWRTIVGLQLAGLVQPIAPHEVGDARGRYLQRFPFAAEDADPALARALRNVAWYRYRIDEAVLIDNRRGIGRRLRWRREPPPLE